MWPQNTTVTDNEALIEHWQVVLQFYQALGKLLKVIPRDRKLEQPNHLGGLCDIMNARNVSRARIRTLLRRVENVIRTVEWSKDSTGKDMQETPYEKILGIMESLVLL